MRVLSRFTTSLPNIVYFNATHDLGIGVDEFSIFTDLYSLLYGLQLLNERDMTCHLVHRDIKGILITRRADPGSLINVQLNLEDASINS